MLLRRVVSCRVVLCMIGPTGGFIPSFPPRMGPSNQGRHIPMPTATQAFYFLNPFLSCDSLDRPLQIPILTHTLAQLAYFSCQ